MENEIAKTPTIRFSEEVSWHIKCNFGFVSCASGNEYFHDPHWHKLNEDGSFTVYSYEDMPSELKDAINNERGKIVRHDLKNQFSKLASIDEAVNPDDYLK